MDVDLMKPSAQDQMEMMTMMMQLDRLPHELSGPYSTTTTTTTTTSELPEMDFFGGSAATVDTLAPIFHHNPPSSIPFLSSPVQEPMTSLGLAPNAVTPRFRISNPSELSSTASYLQRRSSTEAMREMIFRIAVMQPVHIDPESVKPPKRRNVKISKDPQSVAARHRRERISERIRTLQRLVPGGSKMDTASMLDEAIHYVKFLKKQVQSLEQAGVNRQMGGGVGFPTTAMMANMNYSSMVKACQPSQMVGSTHMLR